MKRYILLSLCCLYLWAGLRANNGNTEPDRLPTDTASCYEDLRKLRQKHILSVGQVDKSELQNAAAFRATVCLQGTEPIPNEVARSLSAAVRSLAYAACADLPEGEQFSEFIDTILANRAIERIPKMVYSRYGDVRDIPAGFLSALPACNARQQGRLIAAVKQLIEFEKLYQNAVTVRNNVNTDYLYNMLPHLFICSLHQPDKQQAVKDLQAFSHYLSACTQYSSGSKDGLKPDGTGFHHHTHYNGYMYAYKTWVQYMDYLKGTVFRIDADAYQRIKKAVVSKYLMATLPLSGNGHYFANSLAGRHPFAGLAVDFGQELFRKLAEVGGDIENKEIDEELAAYHNAFFPTNPYPQIAPKKLEGFYQFNYSPAGVYRHDNWVATMRCPTTVFWGGEIYNKTNRFGRYQSHGTLEILYNGALEQSGYPAGWKRFEGKRGGWDWNVVPGSTTVHYTDWKEMMPNGNSADRFDQWSVSTNFSGALSWGDCGLFACAFDQGDHWGSRRFVPTRLTFCKSVFAFDGILVSLGSGIGSQGDYANDRLTATNLFQALACQEEFPFLLNGKKVDKETHLTLHTDKDYWLLTPCTTGYLVPAGNDPLTVFYGEQTTPGPEGADASSFHNRLAAKAFINHGIKPAGKRYCYAVVPHTTPQTMKTLSKRLFHKKGIFDIRQQQDSLHIVKHIPSGTLAYALFAPATALEEGVLQASDTPLLLMERRSKKKNLLELAVCSPDLRPKPTGGSGKEWTSTPTLTTLLLKGNWQASGSEGESLITCSYQEGKTKVVLELKEGLPLYLKFCKATPMRDKTTSASGKKQGK